MTISVEDARAALAEAEKRKTAAKDKWMAAEDIAEACPTRRNMREATARYHDHHTAIILRGAAKANLRAAEKAAQRRTER